MIKFQPSHRWHRAGGHPVRRATLRSRYACSFVIGWAMVPFLSAHGNAQNRCDSPACDCRIGQATPCDAVGGIHPRSFDSLMLPALAQATLTNTDRLGNSIESATLKWIERSKQLSARWRFSDASCDASGPASRDCGSEHPPITSYPAGEISEERSAPFPAPEWTELPMATSDSVATPPTPGPASSPELLHQAPGALEVPQLNKQNPLIDPFSDDPHQPAPIIPSVQGNPLGQMLRQRRNDPAMPSSSIDVPPVWIASRTSANKRAATEIDQPQQAFADSEPAPSEAIRLASDSQPIRDPSVTPGSKTTPQAPRTKRRPKPFESSQRSPIPNQAPLPAPPVAAPHPPDAKPLPAPAMQSYEEFARRLHGARSTDSRPDESTSQPSPTNLSLAPSATSEAGSGSTVESPTEGPAIPALTSEPSIEEAKTSNLPLPPEADIHPEEAGELPVVADKESIDAEVTQLQEETEDGVEDAQRSDEERSKGTNSAGPNEDVAAILDARITQRILNQLQIAKDRGMLRQFELDVSTVGGEVWVRGFVSRPEHKQLILDTIQQVPGVVVVIDDVSIARPMPAPRQQEGSDESLGSEDLGNSNPKITGSADGETHPERGLALPKWLRPKATGRAEENTDFRSTLQSTPASSKPQGSNPMGPRVRTRGAFGASGGADRSGSAAPLSSPVVPGKPNPPNSTDRGISGNSPVAGPEEQPRGNAAAAAIPDSRADIDRRTKARLAATAARVDQPTTGSSGHSNRSLPTPPAASEGSPKAATSQGSTESNSEQGLDLNSFLQRVNAAKQAKDRPE